MFGLSITEIIVILIAIVIFVGPNQLPEFLRDIRKLINYFRSLFKTANAEYDSFKKAIKIDDEIDIEKVNQELTEIIGDDGNKYLSYGSPLDNVEIKDDAK